MIDRVVIWFSAGVTSAIAAKIAVDEWRGKLPVHLVNTDTGAEDEDNFRFMNDVANWLDLPLEIIRSEKYKNTFEVFTARKFFKNQHGAPCTLELKKLPRRLYERVATDLQVFGYDANERARAARFVDNNPEVQAYFPLIERGLAKTDCRQLLAQACIKEPRTYAEGFRNANCLNSGCVKGGMGYWNHIRKMRPDVFWRMAAKERELGYALLKSETTGENSERIATPVYLDELPENAGNYDAEPGFQCGLFCGL
jgi:3'-phosphoadenosine 5'-phosphosulfate sulfotransferase (PAPS reductase)/FAD synthetase